jgi:hypothetical protein
MKDFSLNLQKTVAFRKQIFYYWNQAGEENNSHQSETNLIKTPEATLPGALWVFN